MKSRLLIGVAIAAFALATATDVSFAATKHKHATAKPVTTLENGIPNCGKGMLPVQHGVAMGGKTHWSCMKPA